MPTGDGSGGYLLSTNGSGTLSWAAPTTSTPSFSALTTGTNSTATLTVGTGALLTTSGTGKITANEFTGSGSTTTAVDLATTEVAGTLPIARGGTNSTAALNGNRFMLSSGTAIVESGSLTNGQLLIGSTGVAPVVAALTGTTNQINVTNGAGSITLATPQDIHSGASPTFLGLTVSGLTDGVAHVTSGSISGGKVNLASSSDVTGTTAIGNGGTGATSLTGNGALVMNAGGTATTSLAASTSGNVMTSNGTTWVSQAPAAATWATPGTIGSTTPNTGAFTTLGVGTTSPGNTFQVQGSYATTTMTSATSLGSLRNTSTVDGSFTPFAFQSSDTGGTQIISARIGSVNTSHGVGTNSGDLYFETTNSGATSERMRIMAAGNVGIGSTNPQNKLDVVGTASGSSATDPVAPIVGNITGPSVTAGHFKGLFGKASGSANGATQSDYGVVGYAKQRSANGFLGNGFGVYGTAELDPSADNNNTMNGYGLYGKASLLGSASGLANTYNLYGAYADATSADPGASWTTTNYGIYATAANADVNWAGYFVGNVYASGNVGIGTTAPLGKLQTALDVNDTDVTNGLGQFMVAGTTNGNKHLIMGYNTTSNYGYLQGNTFGSTWDNLMLEPKGGNVGIGTTSAVAKLEVNGGVKIGTHATCDASNAGAMRWTGSDFEGCNGTAWISLTTGSSAKIYCGATASTYTGSTVGGAAGATTKCRATAGCSATTATMCTEKEVANTKYANSFSGLPGDTWLWYDGPGASYEANCSNWTSNSASNYGGAVDRAGTNGYVMTTGLACSGAFKIMCCD